MITGEKTALREMQDGSLGSVNKIVNTYGSNSASQQVIKNGLEIINVKNDSNGDDLTDKTEIADNGGPVLKILAENISSDSTISYEVHYYDPIESECLQVIDNMTLLSPLLTVNNMAYYQEHLQNGYVLLLMDEKNEISEEVSISSVRGSVSKGCAISIRTEEEMSFDSGSIVRIVEKIG